MKKFKYNNYEILIDDFETSKLFNEIAVKYEGRVGGYTRIIKKGQRKGDAEEVVILELV